MGGCWGSEPLTVTDYHYAFIVVVGVRLCDGQADDDNDDDDKVNDDNRRCLGFQWV